MESEQSLAVTATIGRDLRLVHTGVTYGAASRTPGSSVWRLRPRQTLFLVVLALHAGILALLLMPRAGERLAVVLPSIQAQIMTDVPVHPPTPPLPLAFERPHIDLIPPDVAINEPAPNAPTASPPTATVAAAAAPVRAASGPAEPVTPPRFDAAYLHNPAPIYPMSSRRLHEQGTVLLRVRVSPEGTAEDVLIEHTSGSERLNEAAMEAVRHWRFVPARSGAQAVEAWVLVPVEFELKR